MLIVTGGAGFIGSNLIHALNRAGHDEIAVVDEFRDADAFRNLNRCRFRELRRPGEFLAGFEAGEWPAVEAVLHQGACSSTTEKDGRYLLETNIDFTRRLLAACQRRRVRLLYASSASVYGDGADGFVDDRPECEYPLNGYAFSKWVVDREVRALLAAGTPAAQVVGLRYFNVYGPQEWHKGGMCSPVLHFHRQIGEHGALRLFAGSEGFRRDFIHVDDVCAVNLHFLRRPQVSGIFNCGTGEAHSFAEVADAMLPHYPGARREEIPFPPHLKGKYQAYTCADLRRLREAGFTRGFLPLALGVRQYVELLRSRHGGYLP